MFVVCTVIPTVLNSSFNLCRYEKERKALFSTDRAVIMYSMYAKAEALLFFCMKIKLCHK